MRDIKDRSVEVRRNVADKIQVQKGKTVRRDETMNGNIDRVLRKGTHPDAAAVRRNIVLARISEKRPHEGGAVRRKVKGSHQVLVNRGEGLEIVVLPENKILHETIAAKENEVCRRTEDAPIQGTIEVPLGINTTKQNLKEKADVMRDRDRGHRVSAVETLKTAVETGRKETKSRSRLNESRKLR